MQAIIQSGYGAPDEVLALDEIPEPTIGDDEVLIRVHASSVHPDVWHVVTGHPRVLRLMDSGWRAPEVRVPGTDLAGVVEAVGSGVTRFRPGDAVFGETIRGQQQKNGGAWAEVPGWVTDTYAHLRDGTVEPDCGRLDPRTKAIRTHPGTSARVYGSRPISGEVSGRRFDIG